MSCPSLAKGAAHREKGVLKLFSQILHVSSATVTDSAAGGLIQQDMADMAAEGPQRLFPQLLQYK